MKSVYRAVKHNNVLSWMTAWVVLIFGVTLAVPAFAEEVELESETREDLLSKFNLNYFGIFYGPSLSKPSSYQPSPTGTPDTTRPVNIRNFLGLTYNFSDEVAITGTAYWIWQPVMGQQLIMQDPFIRLSHNSILNIGNFNIYADVRTHFPVTALSRENDLLFGLQTFQAFTYEIAQTGLVIGIYSSERVNFYGKQGFGNDFELYLAPNIYFQMTPKVALTLLYEVQASHSYRTSVALYNDSLGVVPGVSWDVTPRININPYLQIPTQSGFNLSAASLGMFLSWNLI